MAMSGPKDERRRHGQQQWPPGRGQPAVQPSHAATPESSSRRAMDPQPTKIENASSMIARYSRDQRCAGPYRFCWYPRMWNFIRRISLGVHCPEMSHPTAQMKYVAGSMKRPATKNGRAIRWARFTRKASRPRAVA